jgi:hypothetical protein
MPKVYNKRQKDIPKDAVYVGRPTAFGNPFSHWPEGTTAKKIVPTRDDAVRSFEEWVKTQPHLMLRIKTELKGKDLVCWCAPLACHADVLLKLANEE